ncbi:MAG TPA: hypothetical protein VGK35_12460 [Actinotalea sp.]
MASLSRPVSHHENPRRLPARRSAPLAVAALLVATLAGCSATNEITTEKAYAASDGIRTELGSLTFSNVLVLTTEKGAPGTVLAAVSNEGTQDSHVTIGQTGTSGLRSITVKAGQTVIVSPKADATVDLPSVEAAPGGLEGLTLTSDVGGSKDVQVPVLDGTLAEYATLVPSP